MHPWITLDLAFACVGGFIGALMALVKGKKPHGVIEGILDVLIGVICAAGASAWVGSDQPYTSCVIGVAAGASGGLALETITRQIPLAVSSLLSGWIEKAGGKPLDKSVDREPP